MREPYSLPPTSSTTFFNFFSPPLSPCPAGPPIGPFRHGCNPANRARVGRSPQVAQGEHGQGCPGTLIPLSSPDCPAHYCSSLASPPTALRSNRPSSRRRQAPGQTRRRYPRRLAHCHTSPTHPSRSTFPTLYLGHQPGPPPRGGKLQRRWLHPLYLFPRHRLALFLPRKPYIPSP